MADGSPHFEDFLPGVQEAFNAFRPVFGGDPADPADFREQAERESGAFFDKDVELLMKEVAQTRTQFKEQKEQAERQEAESFTEFERIQDRGFAAALGRASGRFAGRGTSTSGFKRQALGDFFQDKEDTITGQERELRQTGERRELDFSQFLGRSELGEERGKLGIERGREQEIAQRQLQLSGQASARQQAAFNVGEGAFEEAIGTGFADFLRQKASV